ncbi:1,4-alpha-glucan branching protein GlgB [Picosynechococcus sp. PCC 7117]|uniref:1,4-alpha-glucan branching protein GlgB n=1 Tax=Picosynechococcus sp. PCC 7117 TaxID=195498 RepID=UPI00081062F9|nr:1,4-alpha-glucan branching protein GlgB [Picosynechococcus sp. PCC 7117]ANV87696.1 1,4-alpha-glucan branching enzyme [Picosynechococcus sp. PCC 7117]
MPTLLTPDQINQIVSNHHDNPHAVLGCHPTNDDPNPKTWSIRAYLPSASQAWVIDTPSQTEHPMTTVHHPHFFECTLQSETTPKYQLKLQEGDRQHIINDPYAFAEAPHISDLDLHLFAEGNHHRIYNKLGAHLVEVDGIKGVYFAVWAPNARNVSILGDFNNWDGRKHQMRRLNVGIWGIFIPDLGPNTKYKYEIKNQHGHIYEKSDPYGFLREVRPDTASIVADLDQYQWQDHDWLEQRAKQDPLKNPVSIYELHLGSWLHGSATEKMRLLSGEVDPIPVGDQKPGARFLSYYELVDKLIPYVKDMGYTHIELLPVAEHPFDGSWGYQVTGYYSPTSRFGNPEDLMYFIDQCHANGIGVIVDWVPGHFPKDAHGLAYFDGTYLYEHADPRKGEHKGWGTLIFNYNRNEVRNFLIANALFWFDKYHIDGIRVDAVASMLYLDYDREDGEWLPNDYGGNEHLEAVEFLRQTNNLIFKYYPGIISVAEESTAWPMVSRPTYLGGLGFNLKWNMGWMHDNLKYFSMDPWFRQHHQNSITFSMWYHHSENYMLALSHDEVVHGKSSIIGKMPGDEWQKFANVRALFAYMFTHPGKKTMFMSMEFGQWNEWNVWSDLSWDLLQHEPHAKLKGFFGALNSLYKQEPALYERDFEEEGFQWIDCSDNQNSVLSFIRRAKDPNDFLVVVCNFTPQPHSHYRIGIPEEGYYQEILNSDAETFGGSNLLNFGGVWTEDWRFHNLPYSIDLCLPPLGVVVLKIDREKTAAMLAQKQADKAKALSGEI